MGEAPVSVRYKCSDKHSVQVDYNIPGKSARAQVTTGKKTWIMKRVDSGSGIRYEDSKKSMQWTSKGADGRLTDLKTGKSTTCTEFASSR
jgi:membrane-bound inhibitor of C-type lysozyme